MRITDALGNLSDVPFWISRRDAETQRIPHYMVFACSVMRKADGLAFRPLQLVRPLFPLRLCVSARDKGRLS